MKKTLSIPVTFEKLKEYKSNKGRFTEVKIWLMHLGENYHGSYFSKDTVIKALPTLANTPILGFINKENTGREDFEGHKKVFEWVDGERSLVYKGSAYGVIPESNEAQFEMRKCDDGITREFLTVKGLLWNKNNEALDIFLKDGGVKSQSMELYEDDFDGYEDENGLFHFTRFEFFGACILGRGHNPAMEGAKIELAFERATILQEEIRETLLAFEKIKEGGLLMEENPVIVDEVVETTVIEEVAEEIATEEQQVPNETVIVEEEIVAEPVVEEPTDFGKDEKESDEEQSEEESIPSVEEHQEAEKETAFEETPVVEEAPEIDYKMQFETLQAEHEALIVEIEELRIFRRTVLEEKRKAEETVLFEKYKALDGIDAYEKLKEVSTSFETITDLEKEIALIYVNSNVKPQTSFAKDDEPQNKYYFEETNKEVNSRYGYLAEKYKL